jgi:hypothetical protein
MNITTYTTTELELLIANGISAVKTLKARDADATQTEKLVEAMQTELENRYLSIEI